MQARRAVQAAQATWGELAVAAWEPAPQRFHDHARRRRAKRHATFTSAYTPSIDLLAKLYATAKTPQQRKV